MRTALNFLRLALLAMPALAGEDPYANASAYVRAIVPGVAVQPLLTVGQRIPLAGGDAGETFRVVGVPDGLGIVHTSASELVLLLNHEWGQAAGLPAGPLPGGARVSEFRIDIRTAGGRRTLHAISGRNAIARVWAGEPPALLERVPAGFSKFCSSFLADGDVGFDRPVYLTGEEAVGEKTFDGRGGIVVALCGQDAYTLPWMGRAKWENIVVAPFTRRRTVAMLLEDGPEDGDALNSQLYMYVGAKQPGAADPLVANGLMGGQVYVFVGRDSKRNSEASFATKRRSVRGRWKPVDGRLSDAAFDAASRAAGGFAFVRIEDGVFDPVRRGEFWFVSTGDTKSVNRLGRLYRLTFDPERPTNDATLTYVLDDRDGIIGPDNIGMNRHGEIMIQEDAGFDTREIGIGRDSSIWLYRPRTRKLVRIAEIDREAARAHALGADPANQSVGSDHPGGWETSGIVDAEPWLGRGGWLFDVQAHSLRIAPANETVQGGQILSLIALP